MGLRVSVFLVCVGAILAIGTEAYVAGVDLTVLASARADDGRA